MEYLHFFKRKRANLGVTKKTLTVSRPTTPSSKISAPLFASDLTRPPPRVPTSDQTAGLMDKLLDRCLVGRVPASISLQPQGQANSHWKDYKQSFDLQMVKLHTVVDCN